MRNVKYAVVFSRQNDEVRILSIWDRKATKVDLPIFAHQLKEKHPELEFVDYYSYESLDEMNNHLISLYPVIKS